MGNSLKGIPVEGFAKKNREGAEPDAGHGNSRQPSGQLRGQNIPYYRRKDRADRRQSRKQGGRGRMRNLGLAKKALLLALCAALYVAAYFLRTPVYMLMDGLDVQGSGRSSGRSRSGWRCEDGDIGQWQRSW